MSGYHSLYHCSLYNKSLKEIIVGVGSKNNDFELFYCVEKSVIYHCKRNNVKPSIQLFKIMLSKKYLTELYISKWFEPRSISSSYSVIVRVRVVLRRTVVGQEWKFFCAQVIRHCLKPGLTNQL